ncbi:MAG: type II toxin-antitoxin system RelE/ParE family toxin [Anaerolineales bacterium]|nr:type II toxin-antitoxin system RelE/ParE family toxin [Anaerolineales bacterium]
MYTVKFTQEASKQLAELNKTDAQQVLKKLRWLTENFEQATHQQLTGALKGIFKLRVGDYRALYTFDSKEEVITVHMVKHRREVYKIK